MARIPAVIQKPKITTRPGKASTATIVKQPELAPPTAQAGSRARRKVVGLKHGERRLLQAATDWVVMVVCVSGIFLTSTRGYPNSHIVFSLGVVSFLWFLITDAFDTYKSRTLQSKSFSAYSVAQVLFPMGIAYIIISWLVGGFMPVIRPRISEMVTALLLLLPLLLARSVLAMVLSRGPLRRRIAVVGANADGYEMVDALLRYPGYSYEFVGFYDDVTTARGSGGRLSA